MTVDPFLVLVDRQLACLLSPDRCSCMEDGAVTAFDRKYHKGDSSEDPDPWEGRVSGSED